GTLRCHPPGAVHTPFWRKWLNNELNCNACGLYSRLVIFDKEDQPFSPLYSLWLGIVKYIFHHAMVTPLWRKDDQGKMICNGCGLYCKKYGSPRPIGMKFNVMKRRSK
ncbi:hypothetical protein F5051DRAFT_299553, partial [Lentinula edodes]